MGSSRREFLRGSLRAGAGLLLGGSLLELFVGCNEKPTPQPENIINVPDTTYFERLEAVINRIQERSDLAYLRNIYLGNVNDFDRMSPRIDHGTISRRTGGPYTGVEMLIDAKTGEQVVREIRGEDPISVEIQFFIPQYMTNFLEGKKDTIRMLYLDSVEDPFLGNFQRAGYNLEESVRRLLPGVDIKVEQEVIEWKPDLEIYWGMVSGGVKEPDKIEDGKFLLSNNVRYILFTQLPLKIILNDERGSLGFAHLYQNLAGVNLHQFKNESYGSIMETVLMELGHMYGIPHCWELECPMSYRDLVVIRDPTTNFGERCLMMGKNIASGKIARIKDEDNPRAYFESGRTIPEEEAKKELERHLQTYFSDILPTIGPPKGLRLETTLGRKVDAVTFYHDNRLRMELTIPGFIESVRTYN